MHHKDSLKLRMLCPGLSSLVLHTGDMNQYVQIGIVPTILVIDCDHYQILGYLFSLRRTYRDFCLNEPLEID